MFQLLQNGSHRLMITHLIICKNIFKNRFNDVLKSLILYYPLTIDYMDLIIYTGFGYPGRDLLLTRSSDVVICGCGRIGTIHEFTVAFEDGKTIGILKGPWEMSGELEDIIKKSNRPNEKIVIGDDPKKLVADVIAMVKKHKIDENKKTP